MSQSMPARRAMLKSALSLVCGTAAVVAAMPLARAQSAKLAQNAVQYQQTPKDGAMCSGCVNFQPPNACAIVDGEINPNGWCVAFAPKAS